MGARQRRRISGVLRGKGRSRLSRGAGEPPRFLDRIHPDLVQYQAGVDAYHRDPVGRIPGVSARFLAERDQPVICEVRQRGIPLVINVAGGYLEGVSERLHINTVRRAAQWLDSDAASTDKEVMA